jgi:hypothetical protein
MNFKIPRVLRKKSIFTHAFSPMYYHYFPSNVQNKEFLGLSFELNQNKILMGDVPPTTIGT